MSKGKPRPTRFNPLELRAIDAIQERTGLSVAEIVRKSVRLLYRACKEQGTSVLFDIPDLDEKELAGLLSNVPKGHAPAIPARTTSRYSPSPAEIKAMRTNESQKKPSPQLRSTRPGVKRTVAPAGKKD